MNCVLLTNSMSRITFLWRMWAASEQIVLYVCGSLGSFTGRTAECVPSAYSALRSQGQLQDSDFASVYLDDRRWEHVPNGVGVPCWPAGCAGLMYWLATAMTKNSCARRWPALGTDWVLHVLSSCPFCSGKNVAGKALRCQCTSQGSILWVPFPHLPFGFF